MLLSIEKLTLNPEFQVRFFGCDKGHVQDIKEAIIEDESSVPPVEVVRILTTEGGDMPYYLIDGFHRVMAYRELGYVDIEVEIVGTLTEEEALIATLRHVNRHKAKKLSRVDKENIVLNYLRLMPDKIDCSFNELARQLNLSAPFIKTVFEKNSVRIKAWRTRRLLDDFSDQQLIDELEKRGPRLSFAHRMELKYLTEQIAP